MTDAEKKLAAISAIFAALFVVLKKDFGIDVKFPSAPPVVNDSISENNAGKNLYQFLELIKLGESNNRYDVLNGGSTFGSYATHPFDKINFRSLGLESSASGAYQIIIGTWRQCGGQEKFGDFSPESQDACAVDILKRRGAFDSVINGDFKGARLLLLKEWDFFNRGKYSDPEYIDQLARSFKYDLG